MKQSIKHWIGILLILLFVGGMVQGAQAANVASGTGENAIKLDETLVTGNGTSKNRQYYSEALNGVYFVNDIGIYFFSFATEKYQLVYSLKDAYFSDLYETNGKLYALSSSESESRVIIYDLDKQVAVKELSFSPGKKAIGVDALGRLYLAYTANGKNGIYLYDAAGKQLSTVVLKGAVHEFGGFDTAKGTFFVAANYVNEDGNVDYANVTLQGGRVVNNVIEMSNDTLSVTAKKPSYVSPFEYPGEKLREISLWGNECYRGEDKLQMFNGRYLVVSSVSYQLLCMIDADTYVYGDTKPISLLGAVIREDRENEYRNDVVPNVGTRAIYNANNKDYIVYNKNKQLVELDTKNGIIVEKTTAYPVYNLLGQGDTVVAIEIHEGTYYIQKFKWKHPTSMSLSAPSTTMKVGEEMKLSLKESGGNIPLKYTYESSNKEILYVSEDGVAVAFGTGTATITCTSFDKKLTASITVKIGKNSVSGPEKNEKNLTGDFYKNSSENNYSTKAAVVKSYLWQTSDGNYVTLQNDRDAGCVITNYDSAFKKISTKKIANELPEFGGFFEGKDAYYIVWGQINEKESDKTEVFRVVKYSKTWVKQGSCSIKGANTQIPFQAGSCRMAEINGSLYIRTCHRMYKSFGVNHQANVTLVIKEADMTLLQKHVEMEISEFGYVSHSFNQFIVSDGNTLYCADHGDSSPRGFFLSKVSVGKTQTQVWDMVPLSFYGNYGDNYTGASLGGVASSANHIIMAGNTVDQQVPNASVRNIFVSVVGKDGYTSETKILTNYKESDEIECRTPQLVKLSDYRFLVMWEESKWDEKNGKTMVYVRAAILDEAGTIHGKVYTLPMRLSDCAPIVNKNGEVVWFVTDGEWDNVTYHIDTKLYTLHPLDMDSILPFVDVPATSWAYAPVKFAYDRGIVSGTSAATFGPNDYITRAQVAVMLWNMAGKPSISVTKKPFPDVAVDRYYSKAVAWCKANGLVSGNKDGTYAPADFITRQDFIIIIRNYAKFRQIDTTVTDASAYKKCSDAAQVSGYALSAIQWAYNKGLMGSNGKLTPKNNITRAEVTSVLQRFTMKLT